MIEVQPLSPDESRVERLVEWLVRTVNDAYAIGEAGLWLAGATRTDADEIAAAIRRGEMLLASDDGRLTGCARVQSLDATTADLGLLAVVRDQWGSGVGRNLARAAEGFVRRRGATTMQLELLVPVGWTHPEKERLRDWYTRLGYRVTRSAPFDEVAAHLAPQLRTPCEFLVFRKPL